MSDPRPLCAALRALLADVGEGVPVAICYHPDADPGDGSGWSVEIGDRHTYGTIEQALGAEVPGA